MESSPWDLLVPATLLTVRLVAFNSWAKVALRALRPAVDDPHHYCVFESLSVGSGTPDRPTAISFGSHAGSLSRCHR